MIKAEGYPDFSGGIGGHLPSGYVHRISHFFSVIWSPVSVMQLCRSSS